MAEMRNVADRHPLPKVMVDRSGTILYANPAASSLVGRSPSAMEGVDALALVHPEDRNRADRDLSDLLTGRQSSIFPSQRASS